MTTKKETETAIFAGGCFWGIEEGMRRTSGVIDTETGYTGGTTPDPTYDRVRRGKTGHAEAVRVIFDPSRVGYEGLARLFFEIHDPTQVDRQGPDVGSQYRSEIFYLSPRQKLIASRLIRVLRARGFRVATRLTPAGEFHRAEEHHQQWLEKSGRPPCPIPPVKRF